ncbi:MAG TPA: hypothetical protein VFQ22_01865 [Longimicrobiales bacterium]|nr:hypothetical protein [Longimicrobiales bacterium]
MRRGPVRTRIAALALLLAVAAALWALDRGSVERGNRLYHAGAVPEAASVYRRALGGAEPGGSPAAAAYNLGTALLTLSPDSAEAYLRAASEAADPMTAQRALYNLGWRHLMEGSTPQEPDSARASLTRAVQVLRAALRMRPDDDRARWNLQLAQRLLDQIAPPTEEAGRESGSQNEEEIAMRDPSLARSDEPARQEGPQPDDPRPADNAGERRGPQRGSRESWATQDPGPLTREDALDLLTTVSDEPEALLKGILWSHRPDVAWWAGQPYPGGNW